MVGNSEKLDGSSLNSKILYVQWTLDFVQRLCFINNVKRAFILEQNHTDTLIYGRNNLELFRKKSLSFTL